MEQLWNDLIRHGLTPNQFYLLWSMYKKVSTPLINVSMEYRTLKHKDDNKWIKKDGELTTHAKRVVKELEGYFKRSKKKTNKQVMGDDFEKNLLDYNNLWPKIKLQTGKQARANIKNVEPAMKRFFETYDYKWPTIMKATALFLDEREEVGWGLMKNSQYFVMKMNVDRSWSSELADYCMIIEEGSDELDTGHFSENVL